MVGICARSLPMIAGLLDMCPNVSPLYPSLVKSHCFPYPHECHVPRIPHYIPSISYEYPHDSTIELSPSRRLDARDVDGGSIRLWGASTSNAASRSKRMWSAVKQGIQVDQVDSGNFKQQTLGISYISWDAWWDWTHKKPANMGIESFIAGLW